MAGFQSSFNNESYEEDGEEYDIIVCGGGPAGCAAAISAAREGAKTVEVCRSIVESSKTGVPVKPNYNF